MTKKKEAVLYGAYWDTPSQEAKRFLQQHRVNFTYQEVNINSKALAQVQALNAGKLVLPTLTLGEETYPQLSLEQLARLFRLDDGRTILFYGTETCSDCRRAKQYLDRNHCSYQFFDVENSDSAAQRVKDLNGGDRVIPTLIIDDVAYTNPDNSELCDLLNIRESAHEEEYDVAIIGGGPAGLTLAVYALRGGYRTVILEKKNLGGNAFTTEKIKNYPGFEVISGPDLTDRMKEQVERLGAVIQGGAGVEEVVKKSHHFQLKTTLYTYKAKSIVVSTGSQYRRLNIPNESKFLGERVHFCSTCDGELYQDKEVLVIGGGRSALEEGCYLARICKKVTIINNSDGFDADEAYVKKGEKMDNMEFVHNSESVEFVEDENGAFKGLKIKATNSDKTRVLEAAGAFIYVGMVPNTTAFEGLLALNQDGYVKTTNFETSEAGIFAAGDCREGSYSQVANAVGEAVLAYCGVRAYLEER